MKDLMRKIATLKGDRRMLRLVILAGLFMAALAAVAGYRYHLGAQEEIDFKKEQYSAFASLAAREGELTKGKEASLEMISALEKGLLNADTPAMGAVLMQEAFKTYSIKKGIRIMSERALPAAESGVYMKVPVEFQFKAGVAELKDLLLDIRSGPILMGVKAVKIRSLSQGPGLDVSLVVEGAIKKRKGA